MKRSFSSDITEADSFTELPPTTQCLYFHLCMKADSDGFTEEVRKAMFDSHASVTDFNLLVDKRFVIPFEESGVVVIRHWRIHNIIRSDRYHETKYLEEKAKIVLLNSKVYECSEVKQLFNFGNQVATKQHTNNYANIALNEGDNSTDNEENSELVNNVKCTINSCEKSEVKQLFNFGNQVATIEREKKKNQKEKNKDILKPLNQSKTFSKDNNNINNYNIILSLREYEGDFFLKNHSGTAEIIREWLAYKDEKKPRTSNHYDSERGMNILIDRFIKAVQTYGEEAVRELVHEAMSANYMGIVWDRLEKRKGARPNGRSETEAEVTERYRREADKYRIGKSDGADVAENLFADMP